MTWFARVWIVSALFVGIVAAAVSAGEAQDDGGAAQLPPGFELIPVDARAAVVIPSLKRASDDMTQLLDGMERAEMLVGLRPIDQLRALLGLTAAVREAGPALVIVPAGQERMPPLYLIPVMDAEDFLETSFDPAPGGPANAYLHPTGRTIYARSLQQHVALCVDPAVVESYQPAGGLDQALAARIGDRALQLMRRGEIILYADAGMLSEIAAAEPEGLPGMPMLGDFAPPLDLLDAVDASITSLDFDPLGLGVHGVVLLNEENPLGAASGGEPRAASALSHLPAKPFYVAGAIDLRAFGGLDMVSALTAGLIEAPEWVSTIRGIEFAASPSPLGLQGGMLNEAVIHLACDDSKGALEFLRGEVLGRAGTTDARTVAPKWEVAKREIEGISVDAFEIAVTETPPDPIRQLLRTTMFGRRGINGFVGAVEDGLILTFSQRPDVYAAAIKARREGPSLADDPVLAEMRTWLPPDCDFEMYVALGQFSRMINQFAGVFGLGAGTIPEIDPATHPFALAADHQNGTIETGLVIPADVLALIFDTLAERWMAAEEAMTGN